MHASPTAYARAFVRGQHGKIEREKKTLLERLIATMRENGDEKKIPVTLRAILRLLAERKDKDTMRVVTAIQLTAHQKDSIQKQFPAESYAWEVNPDVLGGVMVERGTRLYQMTLRHLLKGFER